MDFFKQFILFFTEWISFANAIYTIAAFLIGLILRPVIRFFKEYKQRQVLSFKKPECGVSYTVRKTDVFGENWNMVVEDEAKKAFDIVKMLSDLKITSFIVSDNDLCDANEVCIGIGLRALSYLKDYLGYERTDTGQKYGKQIPMS